MIVEDEWEDPNLNNDYVFREENGSTFKVDHLYKDDTVHLGGSCNILDMRKMYKDNERHKALKHDLMEHLWNVHGST
jgi:hypothetical protein